MNWNDKYPSKEASLKAFCDQEVLAQSASLIELEDEFDDPDDGFTNKERAIVAAKRSKLKAKEKMKEDKTKERDLEM